MLAILRRLFKVNLKLGIFFFIFLYVLYFCGILTLLFEKNFETEFPVDADIWRSIEQLRNGTEPTVKPFNFYNFKYIHNPQGKCSSEGRLRLVYLIKSAMGNFNRRNGIRRSWGFERRFSDVEIRTLFMLGIGHDNQVQHLIDEEANKYGDIIQATFYDNYYNNTLKTMTAIKWASMYCGDAKFYFFSDDDMYVSTKNVLRFVRNPLDYPHYLEVPVVSLKRSHVEIKRDLNHVKSRKLEQVLDFELDDKAELYAGYVFPSSHPQRHHWSKWYVTLSEYPYNKWPPYATAGCYILSNVVLHNFYYTSQYTPHFRFDDIYLGMLAWKLNVTPVHNEEFHFYKKPYSVLDYRYVIASHGYGNPEALEAVWHQQKFAGNA